MHRFTLGLAILAVGTVIALPFRKSPKSDVQDERPTTPLEDLDLMVLEVTENVQAPVLFEAREETPSHGDREPSFPQPLTYQDLAVPLESDSVFESKFNATTEVVSAQRKRESERLAQLEQRFAEKSFSSSAHPPAASPQATLASSTSPDAPVVSALENESGQPDVSVLQPLPPANGIAPSEGVEKHWIRQPD